VLPFFACHVIPEFNNVPVGIMCVERTHDPVVYAARDTNPRSRHPIVKVSEGGPILHIEAQVEQSGLLRPGTLRTCP